MGGITGVIPLATRGLNASGCLISTSMAKPSLLADVPRPTPVVVVQFGLSSDTVVGQEKGRLFQNTHQPEPSLLFGE